MCALNRFFSLALIVLGLFAKSRSVADSTPTLTWITGSSCKLEQIIGDVDWEAQAQGSNRPVASLTETRFQILGSGEGYSFEDRGKLIFLFGDTISGIDSLRYDGADPLAWSTNTDGDAPLVLNFFTNNPSSNSQFIPIFVQPPGLQMTADDVPNSGIRLSDSIFLICTSGSDPHLPDPGVNNFSDVVTFDETTLPITSAGSFTTNRVISMLSSNLDPKSPFQGHFTICSLHEFGTNVLVYGAGEYRDSDVFLSMVPAATFATGEGTRYFAGLKNGLPIWSTEQSNCVPVVDDNPTNGPAWPTNTGTVGNMSVVYCPNLNMWLMTYDGGRSANLADHNTGVYFTYASQPWGPWAKPQLIFNKLRDHGSGVFIHDPGLPYDDGLDGPIIGVGYDPTNTAGGDFAPLMIERFTKVTNATLFIYYAMSTWNPYTVVKMRSAFTIAPCIDPDSLAYDGTRGFMFSWTAPTNEIFSVDYSTELPTTNWLNFTNIITSTNGTFRFTDHGLRSGGLGGNKFYRVRTAQ